MCDVEITARPEYGPGMTGEPPDAGIDDAGRDDCRDRPSRAASGCTIGPEHTFA
ncbi:MAG: hypothetical protein ACK40C_05510 [Novosphingobium meiothermophilum]